MTVPVHSWCLDIDDKAQAQINNLAEFISSARSAAAITSSRILVLKPKKGDIAEECRQAYKDIDDVMAAQNDLVTIRHTLRPLAVIKA
ncbi:MAG: RtcB family protein [Candidatus Paceibacterota bacterium]|jgi:RNA-splicing ligase RtcB